jgi:hypothetical protein
MNVNHLREKRKGKKILRDIKVLLNEIIKLNPTGAWAQAGKPVPQKTKN